jgi:alpha-beta hydrolase superfamily lysophospholipase
MAAVILVLAAVFGYILMSSPKASGTSFTFTAADNAQIFVRKWVPESAPKGAVQLIHGASENSLLYEDFANFLNSNGYVVYADDHRGHGETAKLAGKRLGIAGDDAWNNIVKDEGQLTGIIKKEYPGIPVFLVGHSMGSLISQDYMERWGSGVNGVVLIGTTGVFPNLGYLISQVGQAAQASPQDPSVFYVKMFASFNNQFAPDNKTGFEWLSRDEAAVRRHISDPLCMFAFSNAFTLDFLKGLRDMWQPDKEALIPKSEHIYITSGSMDPVGGNTLGIMPLIERYGSLGIQDVTYKFYPGARHEILHETNKDEVQQDILGWLDGHLH